MEQGGRNGDKWRLGKDAGEEERTVRVWTENGLESPIREPVSEEHNTIACTKDVTVNRMKYLNTMVPTRTSQGAAQSGLYLLWSLTQQVFPHGFSMKEK